MSIEPDALKSLQLARWTISGALSSTLLLMTGKALLNRSLDPRETLLVNNRYLRMAPRLAVSVVVICLPIKHNIDTTAFLGIIVGLLQLLISLEYMAGMEKGFPWFEMKN